jgi:hypothetical protein
MKPYDKEGKIQAAGRYGPQSLISAIIASRLRLAPTRSELLRQSVTAIFLIQVDTCSANCFHLIGFKTHI